jgi:uncharacterized membrane protein YciS (DUF1049 family)
MSTLRKIVALSIFLVFVLAAAVFAYGNRDLIAIDIGFVRLENVSMTVAFAVTFACGAIFGLLCAGFALLKTAQEKRGLRKKLRLTEAELSALRSIPLQDAN